MTRLLTLLTMLLHATLGCPWYHAQSANACHTDHNHVAVAIADESPAHERHACSCHASSQKCKTADGSDAAAASDSSRKTQRLAICKPRQDSPNHHCAECRSTCVYMPSQEAAADDLWVSALLTATVEKELSPSLLMAAALTEFDFPGPAKSSAGLRALAPARSLANLDSPPPSSD